MIEIISIGTAVPQHSFNQRDVIPMMQKIYGLDDKEARRLAFMYRQSEIETRYTVLADYTQPDEKYWNFIPLSQDEPLPNLDERMKIYNREALPLSIAAINDCLKKNVLPADITHLITVSCTGMSAPGLDLQIAEAMDMQPQVFRTSVNFMGCYGAVHALKLAKLICDSTPNSNVLIVATEICSIHFQKEYSPDNASSSIIFADGSAAVLISNKIQSERKLQLSNFYSKVAYKGKKDMAWELSHRGFIITLSSYIPDLIEQDIALLVEEAVQHYGLSVKDITHWCTHPGGKKILNAIQRQLNLDKDDLRFSKDILSRFGNMSSPTVLFVLKEILENLDDKPANIMGTAFGPGLTMETFLCTKQ
ncbi:type III polyketide synthase [Parafilimonas terrae]|uniref:Predicted naringenin-chalcone synthase n=1 Tax=Parafilimonas terrae TaxID=1465490 RepID=A0A1I5XD97_9BACT|nr:type III polyketide synthase [Parafilimonas terrae]SFQ29955.1 Predicted naringenin-chalcone synthase [Parafilimonas terrae]